MAKRQPNILFIMTDQQRPDCAGGHPVVRTPNLERLAAEGMRFGCAYTVSPVCMPARSSFISGVYPHNHSIWYNAGHLPQDDETFLHHLKEAGYSTAHVGKAHYYNMQHRDQREWEPYMRARGFDLVHETGIDYISGFTKKKGGESDLIRCRSHYSAHLESRGLLETHIQDYRARAREGDLAVWPTPLPEDDFIDGYIGARAVDYLEGYDRPEPFFLFVGFQGPHYPWNAPARWAEMYDPKQVPPFKAPEETPEERAAEGRAPWVREMAVSGRLPDSVTETDLRRAVASYYGKISFIDDRVGRILDTLERRGMREDTVVVFTSDHGEMAGDRRRINKRVFYEESARVPLIVSYPGVTRPGTESPALTDTLDFFATFLDLAGCEPSRRCMGRSLLPVLDGSDPAEKAGKHEVFSEVARGTDSGRLARTTMVRTRRYKYALDDLGRGFLLYDMERDPEESRNLAGLPEHGELEAELRERIFRFLLREQWARYFPGARTR